MVADDWTHWIFVVPIALLLLLFLWATYTLWHEGRQIKRGKRWPVDPKDSWERRRR